jgi:hypothetical protein
MKKLIKISFLLAVLCFAAPVYADEGDMSTGGKTCTQNCGGGLYDDTTPAPAPSGNVKQDESTISEIYSWIYEQISEIVS